MASCIYLEYRYIYALYLLHLNKWTTFQNAVLYIINF